MAPDPRALATIPVALGDRSYDVLIGPGVMVRAADHIMAHVGTCKCAIVTDANVARHHLSPLEMLGLMIGATASEAARRASGRRAMPNRSAAHDA